MLLRCFVAFKILCFVLGPVDANGKDFIETEPDARHWEVLAAQMGLKLDSKSVRTPGVKKGVQVSGHEVELSCSGRLEIQFAAKEVARQMANPCASGWESLKRVVRYLLGKPRAVVRYYRQDAPKFLDICSDSNFAGCLKSRR
eukprot:2270587-Amphidinium_carterae.1